MMTTVNLVDRIGILDTQIKVLKVEMDKLTAELKSQGAGEYVGDKFRGLVVEVKSVEDDKTLKAAIKKIVEEYRAGLSHQYLTAHTSDKITMRLNLSALATAVVA